MKKLLIQICLALAVETTIAQTLVYDQQTATNDTGGSGITTPIGTKQPIGQSFVPTLSSIDFVRLYFTDQTLNGSGSTLYLNLWSGSISNGTLLASTDPVFIPHGFFNYTNLFFSSEVALTPGSTYYFQPFIQSGDSDNNMAMGATLFTYPNGSAFLNGLPQSGLDLWFREGIVVVPEPTTISLLLLGAMSIRFFSRREN